MRFSGRIVALALASSAMLSAHGSASAAGPKTAHGAKPTRSGAAQAAKAAAFTDARVRTLLPTLLNGACPTPDIVTGGQIDSAGLVTLRHEGVRTVLDLRAEGEDRGFDERAVARAARLDYLSLPVTAETLDDRTFDRVRALLSDDARGPFLVHCASGNRVGAAMIPYLVLDRGLPVDSALALARRGGLKSEAMTKRALDYLERHPVARRASPRTKPNSNP